MRGEPHWTPSLTWRVDPVRVLANASATAGAATNSLLSFGFHFDQRGFAQYRNI
jgi:hypothetical protein